MYDGTLMKPLGIFHGTVVNPANGRMYEENFIVVEGTPTSLLGVKACLAMELLHFRKENVASVNRMDFGALTKDQILQKFQDLFGSGLGCFACGQTSATGIGRTGATCQDATATVLNRTEEQALKLELERLESLGVLERFTTATDWISSVVVETKKDGSLRVCIDPRPLNKALKRCHYPMPVVDDILPDIARAKVFSVLNLKSGFWHVRLDECSSIPTTMGTPFGRFPWKRLPFGIAPAPEVFQQRLDEALMGLDGVKVIVDDILGYGAGAWKRQKQIMIDVFTPSFSGRLRKD